VSADFASAWSSWPRSPDGIWRVAGDWVGTGGNTLLRSNASISGGLLSLTSKAGTLQGAEIQTLPTYGYGYYVTRMKVAKVAGVCQAFFWIADGYGPGEIDIEFNTGGTTHGVVEDWVTSSNRGRVHFTLHPWTSATIADVDLAFNPANGFHTYGFLWTPSRVDFTIDGAIVRSFTALPSTLGPGAEKGYLMANTWTGSPTWGGGPPAQDATAQYDWMRFYAGVTSIPPGANS